MASDNMTGEYGYAGKIGGGNKNLNFTKSRRYLKNQFVAFKNTIKMF